MSMLDTQVGRQIDQGAMPHSDYVRERSEFDCANKQTETVVSLPPSFDLLATSS